jgi:hypothetical protein
LTTIPEKFIALETSGPEALRISPTVHAADLCYLLSRPVFPALYGRSHLCPS